MCVCITCVRTPSHSLIFFFWFDVSFQPLKDDRFVIPKSCCSSIDCYLANKDYNDQKIVYDPEMFETLKKGGVY